MWYPVYGINHDPGSDLPLAHSTHNVNAGRKGTILRNFYNEIHSFSVISIFHQNHLDERLSAICAMLVMMFDTALKPPALSLSARATLSLSCSSPSPYKVNYYVFFVFSFLTWSGQPNSSSPRWHCSNSFSRDRRIAVTWFAQWYNFRIHNFEGVLSRTILKVFFGTIFYKHSFEGVRLSPEPPTPFPWLPSSQRTQSILPPKWQQGLRMHAAVALVLSSQLI